MKKDTIFMHMSDGARIAIHRWMPRKKATVKGLVQLSHGMIEYAMRYDQFGEDLCKAGYVLYAHDHRGHGETAETADYLGYLADIDGFQRVVLDLREVLHRMKSDFPGKKAFLFAHSFGSFIGQSFIEQFSYDIDGCILCGTAGPRPAQITFGKVLSSAMIFVFGRKFRSKFFKSLVYIGVNQRCDPSEGGNAWLSRDLELLRKTERNIYSTFVPTLAFYHDMFTGLKRIHSKKALKAVPMSLPVLMISGADDPIGSYGKTVKNLASIYAREGMTDITLKFYEGARHELLNETNRGEVTIDIINWLNMELIRHQVSQGE